MGRLISQCVAELSGGIPPIAFAILIKLSAAADDNNLGDRECGKNIFISKKKLTEELETTIKTTRKYINVLIQDGWVRETPQHQLSLRYQKSSMKYDGTSPICYEINVTKMVRNLEATQVLKANGIYRGNDAHKEIMDEVNRPRESDWNDNNVHFPYQYKKYSTRKQRDNAYAALVQSLRNLNDINDLDDFVENGILSRPVVLSDINQEESDRSQEKESEIMQRVSESDLPCPYDMTINETRNIYTEYFSYQIPSGTGHLMSLSPDNCEFVRTFDKTCKHPPEEGGESVYRKSDDSLIYREPGETESEWHHRTRGLDRNESRCNAILDDKYSGRMIPPLVMSPECPDWETSEDLQNIIDTTINK